MSVRSCVPSRCASIRQASTLSLVAESRTVPHLRHHVRNKWEGKLEGITYCVSFPGSTCRQTVRSTRSSCTHRAKCTAKSDIEGYRSFSLDHLPPSAAPFLPCSVLSCNFFFVSFYLMSSGAVDLWFLHTLFLFFHLVSPSPSIHLTLLLFHLTTLRHLNPRLSFNVPERQHPPHSFYQQFYPRLITGRGHSGKPHFVQPFPPATHFVHYLSTPRALTSDDPQHAYQRGLWCPRGPSLAVERSCPSLRVSLPYQVPSSASHHYDPAVSPGHQASHFLPAITPSVDCNHTDPNFFPVVSVMLPVPLRLQRLCTSPLSLSRLPSSPLEPLL